MSLILFLGEWAVRSALLIFAGAAALWLLRVRNPSVRLMAWTAMLAGSLATPLLTMTLPGMQVAITRSTVQPPATAPSLSISQPQGEFGPAVEQSPSTTASLRPAGVGPFDWIGVAAIVYLTIAGALLARLFIGLWMSFALLRRGRPTEIVADGIEVRESDAIASPVTMGIVRPAMLLPADWREWGPAKLAAVLAHERSHVRRHDPALQVVSAIHRSLLWGSPLSWFLHRSIVRTAEEISDDDAVAVTCDRASYAEILLEFIERAAGETNRVLVPMARYDRPGNRIRRILNSTSLIPVRITRWGVTAILAIGAPLTYLAAAVHPQSASQPVLVPRAVAAAPALPLPKPDPVVAAAAPEPQVQAARPEPLQAAPPAAPPQEKPLAFDAVSVKPVGPPPATGGRGKSGRGGGGPGTSDPGRIHFPAIRLKDLILRAYNVKDFQIVGPDWLNATDMSTRFEVDAVMPSDTTPEQLQAMLRNLLAERFKLAIHKETRELPVYSLVVSKGGLKIKESAPPAAGSDAPALPPGGRNSDKFDRYGFPVRVLPPEGGMGSWFINGRCQLFGARRTMQDLADGLVMHLENTPVNNETGLAGKYDFTLAYARPRFENPPPAGPGDDWAMNPPELPEPLGDIFEAIQAELGLKLEPKKGPRDVVVIDHIEKRPTEN
jgi:uncharacterized protein (TIGR03435 family)